MGINARAIAKKIAQSNASGGGNFFKPGKGRLIVKSLIAEDKYKGDTFIGELLVESSQSYADAPLDAAGRPIQANAPGSSVSFIQQFDEYPDTAFGNVKAFLYALLGESDESLHAQAKERIKENKVPAWFVQEAGSAEKWGGEDEFGLAFELATSKAQPFRGMAIDYETFQSKPTKKTGKILTLPKFSTVQQTTDEVAARRAALDQK